MLPPFLSNYYKVETRGFHLKNGELVLDDGEDCGIGPHNLEDLEGDDDDELKESEDAKDIRQTRDNADIIRTKLGKEPIKPTNSSFTSLATGVNGGRNMNKRLYSQIYVEP